MEPVFKTKTLMLQIGFHIHSLEGSKLKPTLLQRCSKSLQVDEKACLSIVRGGCDVGA